jgi:1,4-dihydroxy-2-naphthoate octaprenyltransferase
VAPVLAGTGAAAHADGLVVWKALVALVVSLALQVGVNYANDYSDGIRGTDDDRVGPMRLVGSGVASPAAVKRAALLCLGVGALAGFVLAATSGWELLGVGVLAILAAWFYTGGATPYGYRGLGELSVFVFFGLVAVMGTTYVQLGSLTLAAMLAGIGVGALACAILVANNLRDIPTDIRTGKRTLAVMLGDARSRTFFGLLVVVALVSLLWLAAAIELWALLGLGGIWLAAAAWRTVRSGTSGRDLIPVLRNIGLAELVYALGLFAGLVIGA